MYKLGIDIGASHIGLGLYDQKKKELITKKYVTYKRPLKIFNKIFNKYFTKKYINYLINDIDQFIKGYSINYIGIGCPGGVDIHNSIFYGSTALVVGKIDFKEALKKYHCPVYVDNDCNCAALGEAINNDYKDFLMITIGTGVGFSLIKKEKKKMFISKDERIWQILKLNKVPNTKHTKYISSFKKLSKSYNEKNKKNLPRNAIFQDIDNNKDLIEEYIENFIIGINLINEKIPIKNICIGGSFALYYEYYLTDLQQDLPNFNIFIAKYDNDSGIIGATQLPIDRY